MKEGAQLSCPYARVSSQVRFDHVLIPKCFKIGSRDFGSAKLRLDIDLGKRWDGPLTETRAMRGASLCSEANTAIRNELQLSRLKASWPEFRHHTYWVF